MKISEMIGELEKLKVAHGDSEIVVRDEDAFACSDLVFNTPVNRAYLARGNVQKVGWTIELEPR